MTTPQSLPADSDQIISLFKSIRANIDTRPTARVREDLFSKGFLPFFLGLPESDPRITMEVWHGLAGGPYNEVSVVDASGKVLFSVPPTMSNRMVAPMTGEGGRALSSLLSHATIRETHIPGTGAHLLQEGLKRFEFISADRDEHALSFQKRWDEIIARYYPHLASGESKQPENKDDGNSIFDF